MAADTLLHPSDNAMENTDASPPLDSSTAGGSSMNGCHRSEIEAESIDGLLTNGLTEGRHGSSLVPASELQASTAERQCSDKIVGEDGEAAADIQLEVSQSNNGAISERQKGDGDDQFLKSNQSDDDEEEKRSGSEFDFGLLEKPLEDRTTRARQVLAESLRYLSLVEDRIEELERKVSNLVQLEPRAKPTVDSNKPLTALDDESSSSGSAKTEDAQSKDHETSRSKLELEPLKLDLKEFCKRRHEGYSPTHVLEVLTEQVIYFPAGAPTNPRVKGSLRARKDNSPKSRRVERIRINSEPILTAFKSFGLDIETECGRCELLRPFKPLFDRRDHLKKHLQSLKSAHDSREKISQEGGNVNQKAPPHSKPVDATLTDISNLDSVASSSFFPGEEQDTTTVACAGDEAKTNFQQIKAADDAATSKGGAASDVIDGLPLAHLSDHEVSQIPNGKVVVAATSAEQQERQKAIDHLCCLLRYMEEDEDMQEYIITADKLRSREAEKVSFENLWHLFAPGDVVFARGTNKQAYNVRGVRGGRPTLSGRPGSYESKIWTPTNIANTGQAFFPFVVQCLYIDYDGEEFGPRQEIFKINFFEEECKIEDLPVFPLKYKQGESLDTLLAAGKRYRDIADTFAHREYIGLSAEDHREWIDSEIMIDLELHCQLNVDTSDMFFGFDRLENDTQGVTDDTCYCSDDDCDEDTDFLYDDSAVDVERTSDTYCLHSHLFVTIKKGVAGLTDDHLRLLPTEVFVYVLKARKWVLVDVAKIQSIKQNSQNFDDLVLDKDTKKLVESLVKHHARAGQVTHEHIKEQDDLVRGKGKGRIILLHGVPGVGKTSTAECVAEATHRPLFSITCGDIGETAKDVQENLEKTFRLARRWGCVLLLDEADVFLQARDREDMRRNAIVSVFLRILEYYSGILFLTTNKVGQFDEAFKSRIHISLYYPPLDQLMSKKIWKLNIRRIRNNKPNLEFMDDDILDWAMNDFSRCMDKKRQPWNGRQIHNAFQTAIALAEYEGGTNLLSEHFNMVAHASKQFDDYLRGVYGGKTDARRAKAQQDRYDDYGSPDWNEFERPGYGPRHGSSYTGSANQPSRSHDYGRRDFGSSGNVVTPASRNRQDSYRSMYVPDDDDEWQSRNHGIPPQTSSADIHPVSRGDRRRDTPLRDEDERLSETPLKGSRTRIMETPDRFVDSRAEHGSERRFGEHGARDRGLTRDREREREREQEAY